MEEKTINHSSRAHALLSASSAHRWLHCPPSAVASEAYPPQDTAFTQEGTAAHEIAELVASGRQVPAGADEDMIRHAEGYRDYIQEQTRTADASVLLEQRVSFTEWVPDGFGTADCIIVQGSTITVIDYKYGQGVAVSAEDNPQMKLYALGAYRLLGDLFEIDTVEMHIYQPRIGNISSWSCSVEDLMAWANKTVKPTAQKAIKGKGEYEAGSHCKFCPHAGRCRTLRNTCVEYVETHGLRAAVPVLAPHEVAEVLQMEPLISLWLKRIKTQAMDSLMSGEDIPGWKVVEGKLGNRKWTDELAVHDKLAGAGYSDDEITVTTLLSPAAMDRSIGKKKVAELLEDMIDRSPGSPTIVPASDKRPALDRLAEAVKDFN